VYDGLEGTHRERERTDDNGHARGEARGGGATERWRSKDYKPNYLGVPVIDDGRRVRKFMNPRGRIVQAAVGMHRERAWSSCRGARQAPRREESHQPCQDLVTTRERTTAATTAVPKFYSASACLMQGPRM
jgi:hypothetical protein